MNFLALENDPEYIQLQTELVQLQEWVKQNNKRVLLIFEGRDTAGKGGAIMRFIRFLNPRNYTVIALDKPTKIEKKQWYFQRYIQHLPKPGEIVFFDRSWYNRAVVEPVMEFCNNEQYLLFMNQVNLLETMLIEDGCILIKFWFSISEKEQQKRLDERKQNPLIKWKLSTVDMKAQYKWDEYSRYKTQMFNNTSTADSPWIIVNGNNKDVARKEAMKYVLSIMKYSNKGKTGIDFTINPEILYKYNKNK